MTKQGRRWTRLAGSSASGLLRPRKLRKNSASLRDFSQTYRKAGAATLPQSWCGYPPPETRASTGFQIRPFLALHWGSNSPPEGARSRFALDGPRPWLHQSSADALEAHRDKAGKALDAPCRFVGLWPPAASNRPACTCWTLVLSASRKGGWGLLGLGVFIQTSKGAARVRNGKGAARVRWGERWVCVWKARRRGAGLGQAVGNGFIVVHGLSRSCPRTGGRSAPLRRSSTYPRLSLLFLRPQADLFCP